MSTVRYATQAMTIDGVVFNPGDIVPESMYPALDAHEAAAAPAEGITSNSFQPSETDAEDEDEEDDEEDETVTIEIEGGLPQPDLDSTVVTDGTAPTAPVTVTETAKGGKKAGK